MLYRFFALNRQGNLVVNFNVHQFLQHILFSESLDKAAFVLINSPLYVACNAYIQDAFRFIRHYIHVIGHYLIEYNNLVFCKVILDPRNKSEDDRVVKSENDRGGKR